MAVASIPSSAPELKPPRRIFLYVRMLYTAVLRNIGDLRHRKKYPIMKTRQGPANDNIVMET